MLRWFNTKRESTPVWFSKFPSLNIYLIYSHMVNAEPRSKLKGYWVHG